MQTPIIGLTGGSGAGKSAAAAYFAGRGAGLVDADALYRSLCQTERSMLCKIQAAFGNVLGEDGSLDRPRLAALVFSDKAKLERLNEITLPYLERASLAAFAAQKNAPFILFDAPTLFQTGLDRLCAQTVGVLAARKVRLCRIMRRDGLSEKAAAARLDAQPDDDFYIARCTHLLHNDRDLAALHEQMDALWDRLCGAG